MTTFGHWISCRIVPCCCLVAMTWPSRFGIWNTTTTASRLFMGICIMSCKFAAIHRILANLPLRRSIEPLNFGLSTNQTPCFLSMVMRMESMPLNFVNITVPCSCRVRMISLFDFGIMKRDNNCTFWGDMPTMWRLSTLSGIMMTKALAWSLLQKIVPFDSGSVDWMMKKGRQSKRFSTRHWVGDGHWQPRLETWKLKLPLAWIKLVSSWTFSTMTLIIQLLYQKKLILPKAFWRMDTFQLSCIRTTMYDVWRTREDNLRRCMVRYKTKSQLLPILYHDENAKRDFQCQNRLPSRHRVQLGLPVLICGIFNYRFEDFEHDRVDSWKFPLLEHPDCDAKQVLLRAFLLRDPTEFH